MPPKRKRGDDAVPPVGKAAAQKSGDADGADPLHATLFDEATQRALRLLHRNGLGTCSMSLCSRVCTNLIVGLG